MKIESTKTKIVEACSRLRMEAKLVYGSAMFCQLIRRESAKTYKEIISTQSQKRKWN